MSNPLFPDNSSSGLPSRQGKPLQPISDDLKNTKAATDLIRQKLDAIYQSEPAAKKEIAEVETLGKSLTKHQRFMRELSTSGKSMPAIQVAWHDYYMNLPDKEKHQVWQEFYQASARSAPQRPFSPTPAIDMSMAPKAIISEHQAPEPAVKSDRRTVADVKRQVLHKVARGNNSRLKAKHHVQSLMFGLGMGVLAVIIVRFSFFNEIIIAPLIQPSRHATSTPLIVTADSVTPSATPEVIVPKINVEIPVDYSQTSTDENVIENALQNGVVHYPNTVMPGQTGNAAFFGHSSNNIFNPGKYKFAFVLLHEVQPNDTFYLTNNGKVYAYQVISRKIVPPSDVSVLTDTLGKPSTATLITCDPPGTSINRLVVTGVQVSPDPTGNTAPTVPTQTAVAPRVIASNGPSLWSRLWSWL